MKYLALIFVGMLASAHPLNTYNKETGKFEPTNMYEAAFVTSIVTCITMNALHHNRYKKNLVSQEDCEYIAETAIKKYTNIMGEK